MLRNFFIARVIRRKMRYQDLSPNIFNFNNSNSYRGKNNIKVYKKIKQSEKDGYGYERRKDGIFVDTVEVEKGTLLVGAEPKKGAEYGNVGAKLAYEAIYCLVNLYCQIYKTEKRIINAITSNAFSVQLNNLFRELVLVYHEDEAERKKREKENEEGRNQFFDFLRFNINKNQGNTLQSNEQCDEALSSEDILKKYATSVMVALMTENHFVLGTLGSGSFMLYNAYEGKKAFSSVNKISMLGEEGANLSYEVYSRGDYAGVLMTSDKLSYLLPDVKTLYRYARQLEKDFIKGYGTSDPFVFTDENGSKAHLLDGCGEDGAFVLISTDLSFKLSLEKEEEYRQIERAKTIEEAKRAHQLEVQKNLEIAKDRSVYESYARKQYEGFEKINVFLARRQGRSHIDTASPCQDYCLSESVEKGIVLAVSDGVGSCTKSDIGSMLACKAVYETVRLIDSKSDSEELFVSRLQSVAFRESIFKEWRKSVIDHISRENKGGKITHDDIFEYAATLMLAVITDNYFIVGNLGDGQVILYNQHESIKLRKHSPKESSKTRSLVNYNGFSECFAVERYRRSEFSSVLLTTDGIYDPLENANELYNYAKEAEKRFLYKKEPYQPFCYTIENEGYKDIFSSKTYDDCSIILATDVSYDHKSKDARFNAISERYDYTIVESIGDISVYASKNQNGSFNTVVSGKKVTQPQIDGIRFFEIGESYEKNGYFFNVYKYTDCPSISKLYQYGMIGEQGETKPNASYLTLSIYEKILKCIDILDRYGYALNQQLSHNLILYDESMERIILYPEAIERKAKGKVYDNRRILSYFDSLYGKLVCQGVSFPVFKVDFNNVGVSKYLTPTAGGCVGVVRRVDNTLYLENCGTEAWYDTRGVRISKGERVPLREGIVFETRGFIRNEVYTFIEKTNFNK